jgi:hypothetical protein
MYYNPSYGNTPYLQVTYQVSVNFDLPEGIKLHQYEGVGFDEGKPGSWFIRWGKLSYHDTEGKCHEVKGRLGSSGDTIGETVCDADFKRHEENPSEEAYGVGEATDDPDEPVCVGCKASYTNCSLDCPDGKKRRKY